MRTKIGNNLILKWMILLTLSTVLPVILVGLSVVLISHQGLWGSFIAVEGIVLVVGVLFSFFFLASKLALPFEEPPKDKLPSEGFYSGYAGKKRP